MIVRTLRNPWKFAGLFKETIEASELIGVASLTNQEIPFNWFQLVYLSRVIEN